MNEKEELNKIFENEEEKMTKYLQWYASLEGNFSGKIRINREYIKTIKEELRNSTDAYPTKLAYMLNINPMEYNEKYPNAVMYENYKMKAYSILYLNSLEQLTGYEEDIGFAIGLELILKEFVDNHPEWSNIIQH